MRLRFEHFDLKDFAEYRSWYADTSLNRHLGPMDDDWLHAVLQEVDGCTFSVFRGEELIAVVGVTFPDAAHPSYYLTDFAVKPELRAQGIGSEVLKQLMLLPDLQAVDTWKAFVGMRNPEAKNFFERNGWKSSEGPDADGMYVLQWKHN